MSIPNFKFFKKSFFKTFSRSQGDGLYIKLYIVYLLTLLSFGTDNGSPGGVDLSRTNNGSSGGVDLSRTDNGSPGGPEV